MKNHKQLVSLTTASNAVELGTKIVQSVSGDTLNGNKMKDVRGLITMHLSNELVKKGRTAC